MKFIGGICKKCKKGRILLFYPRLLLVSGFQMGPHFSSAPSYIFLLSPPSSISGSKRKLSKPERERQRLTHRAAWTSSSRSWTRRRRAACPSSRSSTSSSVRLQTVAIGGKRRMRTGHSAAKRSSSWNKMRDNHYTSTWSAGNWPHSLDSSRLDGTNWRLVFVLRGPPSSFSERRRITIIHVVFDSVGALVSPGSPSST